MLIFHAWVIYFFHSAACTTEQAALGPSLQVLARRQSTSADPWVSLRPGSPIHHPPFWGTRCIPLHAPNSTVSM